MMKKKKKEKKKKKQKKKKSVILLLTPPVGHAVTGAELLALRILIARHLHLGLRLCVILNLAKMFRTMAASQSDGHRQR